MEMKSKTERVERGIVSKTEGQRWAQGVKEKDREGDRV